MTNRVRYLESRRVTLRRDRVPAWLVAGACAALVACGGGKDPPPLEEDPGGSGGGDRPAAAPRSCETLAPTCGPSGTASCCEAGEVVGGMFYRGYDVAGDASSGDPSHPATLSRFRLDRYEVTVGRFRAFLQAGMGAQGTAPAPGAGAHPRIDGSGWRAAWATRLLATPSELAAALKCNSAFATWTDAPGGNEERPLNCLTWYEAAAFCAWDGGRLPTEAEWSYAAAGGDQQRAYPWGPSAPDATRASYAEARDCLGDGASGCAMTDLVKVGSKASGDARWGHADLAGNVAEWTLDAIAMYPTPCADCAVVDEGDRVVRGGNFGRSTFYLRTVTRGSEQPDARSHGIGARCARAP